MMHDIWKFHLRLVGAREKCSRYLPPVAVSGYNKQNKITKKNKKKTTTNERTEPSEEWEWREPKLGRTASQAVVGSYWFEIADGSEAKVFCVSRVRLVFFSLDWCWTLSSRMRGLAEKCIVLEKVTKWPCRRFVWFVVLFQTSGVNWIFCTLKKMVYGC